ncbi:MAG: ATP-binding protein [Myxococcota bacterium]
MSETFSAWFTSTGFMPHGHCWLWTPGLLWLQVLTNLSIGLAYVAISATLALLVHQIRDIPFRRVYLAFGVFIITCGFTHFMDVWVIWHPNYWTDGFMRLITALASVATAFLLPPLIPQAVALARGANAAHERGLHLQTAMHDLERLYERATEVDRLKTQFFANVSHELRTPLALVLGPLDELDRMGDALPPEARRDVEVAARNARLLLDRVNDLLDVAQIEAGEVRLREARTDLARLVRTAASNFDGLARERRIRLEVAAPGPVWAVVDADRVRRAVLNVLSNAFKFAPKGGRVRVALSADAAQAHLEIGDSGPGIPVGQRDAAFERFRTLGEGPVGRFGSTGLGLPIVRDVVALHGGTVALGDAAEGGLAVRIALPLDRHAPSPAVVAPDPGPEPEPEPPLVRSESEHPGLEEERTASDRPVALVVEDNRDLRTFIRRVLEPDYQVFTAADGDEGADRASAVRPDVIVSDLMMTVPGEELVRRVRRDAALDGVPIVLLTARADESLRVELLRSGAQDWLQKPFLPQELRVRVDNLVQLTRVRRFLQDQLESRSTDLEELARQLGVARRLAERSSQLKSSFLRAVSHELRSPLHAIGLQLAVIERGDAEVRERMLERLRASLARMRALVESLLQKARLEGHQIAFTAVPFDAAALMRTVVDQEAATAEEKGLTLSVDVAEGVGPLRSDPDLVHLILSNLVRNAVKFTAQGGVEVGLSEQEGRHCIRVRDTGPGLPEAAREGAVGAFGADLPPQAHQPGLGLGLSLAQDLARALGGEIGIDTGDEGTTVTVLLPSLEVERLG